ncbi:hypothetical protein [Falsiruegeria mediterranea]|uniref:Uncharacterized protein n=1 Tax=Falsiruegeria mediterranea M17 TaxID=1200281 RepID=A0A2R8CAG5_9RHOB|nr:hypothetical protein [Falsiruegeria mediterranea]SPJ29421.1 hypothetical protein TRM7615_02939 [Falsiruegeria mediterranea M17]
MQHILARIPPELIEKVAEGSAERIGMVVRDATTKKIMAHLQETSATQSIVKTVMEQAGGVLQSTIPDPLAAASGLVTVVQNEQIKGRIDALQTMMGGMQALQTATMVSSVVGLGVTAASTALILSRLKKINQKLSHIEDKIDAARALHEDWDLHRTLRSVEVQLERLAEAELSGKPNAVLSTTEHELHKGFGELHRGTIHILNREQVDPDFLTLLLSALALSGSAQFQALLRLDELPRAHTRATVQASHLREIAFAMPQDKLAEKFGQQAGASENVDALVGEIRLRIASLPGLAETLTLQRIRGPEYLEVAQDEEVEPLLVLAAPGTGDSR